MSSNVGRPAVVSESLPTLVVAPEQSASKSARSKAGKSPRGYRGQNSAPEPALARWSLRLIALFYLTFLLLVPVGLVFKRTFEHGAQAVWDTLSSPSAVHAIKVTVEVAGIATVCNTIFGVGVAILLVRHEFFGKRILSALIDLSIAVSPVVVGLALILIYGRFEPVGRWLENNGVQVIFALPGMVLATIFVSLPLVVRAVAPVLAEDRHRSGAGCLHAGCLAAAGLLARHAALDPLGAGLRRGALAGPGAGRIRCGCCGVGQH